jgi:hypothetical protein
MVALSNELVEVLGDVVVDVREGYEASAGSVTAAVGQHEAFSRSNRPRSSLRRSLIENELEHACARQGLQAKPGSGGSLEITEMDNGAIAVIRLRGAKYVNGELRVIANNGSTYGGLSDDAILREYPYVLGVVVTDHDSLEFFVAFVEGHSEGRVPYLEFGWVHHFQPPTNLIDSAFMPDDGDDLDGWDIDAQGLEGTQA